jgi:hypothetical protein
MLPNKDHKPYLVALPIQNLVPNVWNLIYLSALPNVACRKPIIPLVFVPLTINVMDQNPIGFPNSMYLHVGPYTTYFGSSY